MHYVNIPSERTPSLARQPIHATQKQLDIAQANVALSRSWPQTIVASAPVATFAEQIRKAADKRRQANKQAHQPPNRVRKPVRRARTKGE